MLASKLWITIALLGALATNAVGLPRALKGAMTVVHPSALKSTLIKRWPGDDDEKDANESDHEGPQPKDDASTYDLASFSTPQKNGGKREVKESTLLCHD